MATACRTGLTVRRTIRTATSHQGPTMRKLAVILIASGGLLSACVGYETQTSEGYSGNPNYGSGPHYTSDGRAYYNRDGRAYYYPSQDRDRDGIPNSRD